MKGDGKKMTLNKKQQKWRPETIYKNGPVPLRFLAGAKSEKPDE
jgi:hypothetical protein